MSTDALKELTTLCAQFRDAERELADLDEQWKAKKAALQRLTEEDIPALMTELGVAKIRLDTGETIEVKPDVEASIPKEDQEARARAFAWLEKNGHGSLIKTIIAIQFGRDEIEKALALRGELEARGMTPIMDRSVHAGTLKAFIKEQLAAATELPLELFMARPFNKAKIK